MKNKTLLLQKDADIDWHILERTLHQQYHVHAVTYHKDGSRLTHGEISWANSLCASIKASPTGSEKVWSLTQRRMCCDAGKRECCVREECPAGMLKIVVPIMIENNVEGFVCLGGRPFVSINRIYTDTIQCIIGMDKEEIQKQLVAIRPIDYRTIKEIMTYITSYN